MRCSRALRLLMKYEDGNPPSEVMAHLAKCSSCKEQYEKSLLVQKLISLKKYEQPSAASNERRATAIRREIVQASEDPHPREAIGNVWELLTLEPLPALRYGVAALFVLLVSLQVLTMPELTSLESIALDSAPAAIETSQPEIARTEGPPAEPFSVFPGLAPTNRLPERGGRIDYGPIPSTLADFEY